MGRSCASQSLGRILGPETRQEVKGPCSVLSGVPLGPETEAMVWPPACAQDLLLPQRLAPSARLFPLS